MNTLRCMLSKVRRGEGGADWSEKKGDVMCVGRGNFSWAEVNRGGEDLLRGGE